MTENKNGEQKTMGQDAYREFTRNEAQLYLGVTSTTLDNYIKLGLLKKYKRLVGRTRTYFYKKDLDKLKELRVKA